MDGGRLQVDAGVREGDLIGNKYQVEKVLGAGGMGVVVAARHIHLDERVAIKFLLPEMLSNAEAVSRFAREARAAVKIKSEHVARVFDVGTLDNGAPYMVMEFLDGGDLSAWLEQHGALSVEQSVEFVLQACVAIAEAHSLGIVHRDLKPANLFCVTRADGRLSVKVLDFGISKVTNLGQLDSGSGPPSVTRTSALMGSPFYMSPEQMQSSKDVDALTDVWALGVILYELLTGRVPFLGNSIPDVSIKVARQPPDSLLELRPDVPEGLEAAITKCLAKDRRKRHRNVAELAVALMPFGPDRAKASVERISGIIHAAGLSQRALTPEPSPRVSAETLAFPGRTMPPVESTLPGYGRRKAAASGAIGVLALAAVAAAVFATRALRSEVHQGSVASAGPAFSQGLPVASAPGAPVVEPAATAGALPPPSLPESSLAASSRPAIPGTVGGIQKPPSRTSKATSTPAGAPASASKPNPQAKPVVTNCDPPYYFDTKGNRLFKRECL